MPCPRHVILVYVASKVRARKAYQYKQFRCKLRINWPLKRTPENARGTQEKLSRELPSSLPGVLAGTAATSIWSLYTGSKTHAFTWQRAKLRPLRGHSRNATQPQRNARLRGNAPSFNVCVGRAATQRNRNVTPRSDSNCTYTNVSNMHVGLKKN
jgi:hypothetical protein